MFFLSEDQRALQEAARRFAQEQIVPQAQKYDSSADFPLDIINQAYELGFLNLLTGQDVGGAGLGVLDACVIVEELAAGCAGMATSMVANDLALLPIMIGGNQEQRQRFIGSVISSKQLASFCLTEPSAGSDAAGLKTRVRALAASTFRTRFGAA